MMRVLIREPFAVRRRLRSIEWSLAHRLLAFGSGVHSDDRQPLPMLANSRRILVVRVDELGDVVLTSGFLRELRRSAPAASITLLVRSEMHNLVALCPYVDSVISYDASQKRLTKIPDGLLKAARVARTELVPRRFDLAILPRYDTDGGFGSALAYLSRATARVTFSEKVIAEKNSMNRGLDRLFTHVVPAASSRHEAARNFELLQFIGGQVVSEELETWTDDADAGVIDTMLEASDHAPLVAIGVGAGHPKRIWPVGRFVDIARWLIEKGHRIVVVGDDQDHRAGSLIRNRLGEAVINLAGRTTLRQTAAVMQKCVLFVGNDAGPMHLAAAAGVPVVEMSCHPANGSAEHQNSPTRFGPWKTASRILQPPHATEPCDYACQALDAHCICAISVDAARIQIESLLELDPVMQHAPVAATWNEEPI